MSDTVIVENENITLRDLPLIISDRFKTIAEIDEKIKAAEKKCRESQDKVDALIQANFFTKGDAINSTQNAVKALSDAQNALLQAQTMLFDNQSQMAEVMKYLLLLGASSIAMNRAVTLQLEAKLKQAEEEELSESAQNELKNIIRLLHDQQSAFSRQELLEGSVREHTKAIDLIHNVDAAQDKKDEKHDELIGNNARKNDAQDKKDAEHDKEISRLNKLVLVSLIVGAIALVVSIVGLFI